MLRKQLFKRTALALCAVILAIAWNQTGAQAAACIVDRGQDPLDVVNAGPRHNVWIVMDSSGSMSNPFATGGVDSKLTVAKDVISELLNSEKLVDANGRPLVNWAFAHFDPTADSPQPFQFPPLPSLQCFQPNATGGYDPRFDDPNDLDPYFDIPNGCIGLKDASLVAPGRCGFDTRGDINNVLTGLSPGGITPLGVAFTDVAEFLIGQHRPDLPGDPANTTNFVADLLPDQRNYVIMLTDGRDTCECQDGGYTDTYPTLSADVEMRPRSSDSGIVLSGPSAGTGPFTAALDRGSFNAALKARIALQAIDPVLDGSQGNIFTIGMDLNAADKARVNTIAWLGSGAGLTGRPAAEMNPAFFADDREGLRKAFEDILSRIDVPPSKLSLGAASVASIKEVIATHTNTRVAPLEVMPQLNADPDEFRSARQIRANHRNNVQLATSVEVPGFKGRLVATNIYRVDKSDPSDTSPISPRTDRVADFTRLWEAGEELEDDDPDARPMYFSKRNSTAVIPFTRGNVTPQDLGFDPLTYGITSNRYLREVDGVGALTADDARDIVVAVTRGYRLSVDPITDTIYTPGGVLNLSKFNADGTPTWKLYENATGSLAVVSNPARSPDFDPPLNHGAEYGVGGEEPGDGFYWDHINRRTVVYYPSNIGILHGFDGQYGTELIAYIADDTLGLDPNEVPGSRDTLRDVVEVIVKDNNNLVNHRFTLAGAPTANDAFLRSDRSGGDDDWHTVVMYGRGKGGRFLTALDVTTVDTNPSNLRLLWNKGNREGIVESDPRLDGLGETWSTPVSGPVNTAAVPNPSDTRNDQWLVFAGGGYGCNTPDNEGQFIFAFRMEDGEVYHRSQASNDPAAVITYNALPARPTLFNPHEEDIADNKDFVTRAYIPDMQGKVWKLVTSDVDPANWTFGIFSDMGPDHPITAPVTILNDGFNPNLVFVMAGSGGDRRVPVPSGGFKFNIWSDTDAEGSNNQQFFVGDAADYEQTFFIGERMFEQAVTIGQIGDPATREAVVFFLASEEMFDTNVCVVSFTSTLYAAGIASGLSDFDLDTSSPGAESADLGEGKAYQFARDGNLFVTRSGGLGVDASVDVWGDGEFDDEPPTGGFGNFTVQLNVAGFRISPF